MDDLTDLKELKEAGNEAYKNGDLDEALAFYTKGISISNSDTSNSELATFYKNRAAIHIKNEDWNKAVDDCTKCLDMTPNDPKALFRRVQAYESLGKNELAYKDAREVHNLDKNNKMIQPYLVRLHKAVSQKVSLLFSEIMNISSLIISIYSISGGRS